MSNETSPVLTLAALAEACPHGWVEVEFSYHAGNPTSDPPQDADLSLEVGRLWGVSGEDLSGGPCRPPVLDDLLSDLHGEPPLGTPRQDFTLLVRVAHGAGPCNTCGRERRADEVGWWCAGADADYQPGTCGGAFPFVAGLEVCWGPNITPVFCLGHSPTYASP